MKLAYLKKVRVIISLTFFLALLLLFLDYGNILSPRYTNYFTFLQFVPSAIKFVGVVSLSTTGFMIVMVLTLLFGRVYCSTICPLGTLQDFFSFFSRTIKKKKYFSKTKSYKTLRYSFFVLAILSLISGSMVLINLLDPYSNFGRIITLLFKPVVIFTNNLAAFILIQNKVFYLNPVTIFYPSFYLLLFPLSFFSFVAYLSLKKGRLFCNTVCPVGTFLGVLSWYSLFKIDIEKENCIGCRLCERVCKSGCIDREKKEIDFDRCVSCYNCSTVCPSEGIKYKLRYMGKSHNEFSETDYDKRKFIANTFSYLMAFSGISYAQKKIISKLPSKIALNKKYPISPPGSLSIEHFKDKCTACHLCVSSCPSQVIQPSFLEYGFIGMLQPRMDYEISYCNYDCIICSQVCPSGAIMPIEIKSKKLSQLGKTKFIKENCIVYTEGTDCGACSEHCPTKAVSMVPFKNNLVIPEITDEYCIGCGACEFSCPVKPYKAIYVDGNPVHLTAKKKELKKIQEKVNYKGDFPF